MRTRFVLSAVLLAGCIGMTFGCSLVHEKPEPMSIKAWVLVSNVRYTGEGNEPQYVWVPEDEIPTTLSTVLFGKRAAIAPLHVVPRWTPPPGNGVISRLQAGQS